MLTKGHLMLTPIHNNGSLISLALSDSLTTFEMGNCRRIADRWLFLLYEYCIPCKLSTSNVDEDMLTTMPVKFLNENEMFCLL